MENDKVGGVGGVTRMREMRNSCYTLVSKLEGNKPLRYLGVEG